MTGRIRALLIVGIAIALMVPAMAFASHTFTDVTDANIFHDDISWLADAGVTAGCNPPTNDQFCPGDNVSRQQMAAFMRRFAKYIDAEDGTPGQADNATTADSATTAGDADTVDGMEAAELMSTATGTFREGANGTDVLTVIADTQTELGTITLDAANGPYAVVTFSLYGAVAGDSRVFMWVQSDNAVCNENSGAIPGGRAVSTMASGDFGSLAASVLADTSGGPVINLCILSLGADIGVRDFQLNAVQVSAGSAPTEVDAAGLSTGTDDSKR